jgi:hypothetical protein
VLRRPTRTGSRAGTSSFSRHWRTLACISDILPDRDLIDRSHIRYASQHGAPSHSAECHNPVERVPPWGRD